MVELILARCITIHDQMPIVSGAIVKAEPGGTQPSKFNFKPASVCK